MSQLQTPFRYDYVGSFLRPAKLKKARRQFDEGNISYDELKKVEDEAITELITKIKESGYHVITDGEFRRATWHLDFMWGLHLQRQVFHSMVKQLWSMILIWLEKSAYPKSIHL